MQNDKPIKLQVVLDNVVGDIGPDRRRHIRGIDRWIVSNDLELGHRRLKKLAHLSHLFFKVSGLRLIAVFEPTHRQRPTGVDNADFFQFDSPGLDR